MASEALVLDASVAVKWYLQDEVYAAEAAHLLDRFVGGETNLVAPDYIRYELVSALGVATMRRPPRLSAAAGRQAIDSFSQLGVPTQDSDGLIQAADPLIHQFEVAFYDALYLAHAQRLDLPLITADAGFYERVRREGHAVWVGDWPEATRT